MLENDVKQTISLDYIIPASAYWGLCAVVDDDDDDDSQDDMDYWRRQYEKAFKIYKKRDVSLKQFITEASGLTHIEHWIQVISRFSDVILKKSRISDVLYCCRLCMHACMSYIDAKEYETEELIHEMQAKRETWNESISLCHYIEDQTEFLRSLIALAYDEDIRAPQQEMMRITNEILTNFESACIQKCADGDDTETNYINIVDHVNVADQPHSSNDESSDDDIVWDERTPSASPSTSLLNNDTETPGRMNRIYRLQHFKIDLKNMITRLETRLNEYLGCLRFMSVINTIPLEELGHNKKLLDQLATVFLNRKSVAASEATDKGEAYVYNPPTVVEIQEILSSKEITLAELRETIEIKKLKLGWFGRLKVWIREKILKAADARDNYIMKRTDVSAAMRFLNESNCVDECKKYLHITLKDEIVECYHGTFSRYVHKVLNEYENQSLYQMSIMATSLEEEALHALEVCKEGKRQLSYLHQCNYILMQKKDEMKLNLSIVTSNFHEDK
jgi:hypothetical protein